MLISNARISVAFECGIERDVYFCTVLPNSTLPNYKIEVSFDKDRYKEYRTGSNCSDLSTTGSIAYTLKDDLKMASCRTLFKLNP